MENLNKENIRLQLLLLAEEDNKKLVDIVADAIHLAEFIENGKNGFVITPEVVKKPNIKTNNDFSALLLIWKTNLLVLHDMAKHTTGGSGLLSRTYDYNYDIIPKELPEPFLQQAKDFVDALKKNSITKLPETQPLTPRYTPITLSTEDLVSIEKLGNGYIDTFNESHPLINENKIPVVKKGAKIKKPKKTKK